MLSPDRERRLEARLARERRARREAEILLETKSRELFDANRALSQLAEDLERRVLERTRELTAERQLAVARAEIDSLTGVCNRTAFDRRLSEALLHSRDNGDPLAVFLIDLDDFKSVNDTLGHAAGDLLLAEFAARLRRAIRPHDVAARLGGDEFALIAHSFTDSQGALLLAHRLIRALCRPIIINGRTIPCSCSIGYAEAGSRLVTPDALLSDADLALYASKREGRARVTCFETGLRAEVERRAALDAEVRDAVHYDHIKPWYQPIWQSGAAGFVGAEVLSRWHPVDGSVRAPSEFLKSVEDLGLLDAMMENVVRCALKEAGRAVEAGSLGYLSINVSPAQFNRGWTTSNLPALLDEAQFPAESLVVEITETALLQDVGSIRATLTALTDRGMRIALDDFGVGYSNFALLGKLPFSILKLDRTLICDIETDRNAQALVECVFNLARRLNIKVVAEGVETASQATMLTASGCTTMQGYWIARPQRYLDTWFATASVSPLLRSADSIK